MTIQDPHPKPPLAHAGAPTPTEANAGGFRWPSGVRIGLQLLGFAASIALLVWCIRVAFKPENQAQLQRLADASWQQAFGLLGLSLIIILISGAVFRQALVPIRRLGWLHIQATNLIACLFALLPMKLSVVFRVIVHKRQDKLPLLTIGAWFAVVAGIMVLVLGPVLVASMWRKQTDQWWWIVSLGGAAMSIAGSLIVARAIGSAKAWPRFTAMWSKWPLPGVLKGPMIQNRAHEVVRMVASPEALLSCSLLRVLDVAAQAGRIMLAASILGIQLDWGSAIIAGALYFLIGALAPSGQLGAREGGTALGMHLFLPALDTGFATVVLLVSASEIFVLVIGSLFAIPVMRPDRLLGLTRPAGSST